MSDNENEKRETSADIADEIRRAVESMGDELPYTVSAGTMRRVADRIEAAWKRECEASRAYWTKKCRDTITEHDRYCSPVGNAAAMREALVKCREIALQWQADEAAGVAGTTDKPSARSAAEAVIDMEFEINAALSAPPRVCDVNTLESLSDFVEKTILTSDWLKDTPEIVKSIVMTSVRTALTVAYEPAKGK